MSNYMHEIHPEHPLSEPQIPRSGKSAVRPSGGLLSERRLAYFLSGAPTFGPGGFLKVLAAGQVQVSAQFQNLRASWTYIVAPGLPAERAVSFNVIAQDSVTGGRLPDVRIEVMPQHGFAQTCVTDPSGTCNPGLWFPPGLVEVLATKPGYLSLDKTIGINTDPNNISSYSQVTLLLVASSAHS